MPARPTHRQQTLSAPSSVHMAPIVRATVTLAVHMTMVLSCVLLAFVGTLSAQFDQRRFADGREGTMLSSTHAGSVAL